MLTKKFAKYIQSFSHKKFRDQENAFVAEGPKVIEEFLLSSKFKCKFLLAQPNWLDTHAALLHGLDDRNITTINAAELRKISSLTTPNLVLGVFEKPAPPQSIPLKKHLTLVLDDLQDPGNLGTIIRIADWFGIKHIVTSRHSVDCYNSKVVQAAMGSLLRVTVTYTAIDAFLIKADGIPVFGATLQGTSVYQMSPPAEALLVIGNESKGISPDIRKHCSQEVSIPSFGGAESLNAAVATGILVALFKKGAE